MLIAWYRLFDISTDLDREDIIPIESPGEVLPTLQAIFLEDVLPLVKRIFHWELFEHFSENSFDQSMY